MYGLTAGKYTRIFIELDSMDFAHMTRHTVLSLQELELELVYVKGVEEKSRQDFPLR